MVRWLVRGVSGGLCRRGGSAARATNWFFTSRARQQAVVRVARPSAPLRSRLVARRRNWFYEPRASASGGWHGRTPRRFVVDIRQQGGICLVSEFDIMREGENHEDCSDGIGNGGCSSRAGCRPDGRDIGV